MRVPHKELASSQVPARKRVIAKARQRETPPHILLADGNLTRREQYRVELIAAGFRVSVAATGFETVVKASYHLPDAVVIGDWLEGLDGSESARLIAMCPATAQIPVFTRPDDGSLLERLERLRSRRIRGS